MTEKDSVPLITRANDERRDEEPAPVADASAQENAPGAESKKTPSGRNAGTAKNKNAPAGKSAAKEELTAGSSGRAAGKRAGQKTRAGKAPATRQDAKQDAKTADSVQKTADALESKDAVPADPGKPGRTAGKSKPSEASGRARASTGGRGKKSPDAASRGAAPAAPAPGEQEAHSDEAAPAGALPAAESDRTRARSKSRDSGSSTGKKSAAKRAAAGKTKSTSVEKTKVKTDQEAEASPESGAAAEAALPAVESAAGSGSGKSPAKRPGRAGRGSSRARAAGGKLQVEAQGGEEPAPAGPRPAGEEAIFENSVAAGSSQEGMPDHPDESAVPAASEPAVLEPAASFAPGEAGGAADKDFADQGFTELAGSASVADQTDFIAESVIFSAPVPEAFPAASETGAERSEEDPHAAFVEALFGGPVWEASELEAPASERGERKRRGRSRRGGRGRKKSSAQTAVQPGQSAQAPAVAEAPLDEAPEADAHDHDDDSLSFEAQDSEESDDYTDYLDDADYDSSEDRFEDDGGSRPGRQAETSGKSLRRKMFVSVLPKEQVEVVITEEGQVQEYYVEMLHQAKTKGNIYKGIVHNVDPNLQAAFVSYGAVKNGFLQIDEVHPEYYVSPHDGGKGHKYPLIQKVLKNGQEVLVQVVKEPAGTKGAFLTTYLSLPGRFLVLTPGREQIGVSRKVENEEERARLRELLEGLSPGPGLGVIVRTVSMGASKTNLQRDLQYLKRTWKDVRARGTTEKAPCLVYQEMDLTSRAVRDYLTENVGEIWIDDESTAVSVSEVAEALFPRKNNLVRVHKDTSATLFERFNLQRQLDQIHSREVFLPSGGRLVIDPTEALTAIDINSGRSGGKNNFEDMAYRTNMEAARMIPLQLRLRDIGGQVVADFIEMRDKSHWREVEKTLRNGMKVDRARYDVGRIGPFGMLEIVRQRLGSSAISVSTEPCPCCNGTGVRRNMEWQSQHAMRDILRLLRAAQAANEQSVLYHADQPLAMHLLNQKRQRLLEMEQSSGIRLEVKIKTPEAL